MNSSYEPYEKKLNDILKKIKKNPNKDTDNTDNTDNNDNNDNDTNDNNDNDTNDNNNNDNNDNDKIGHCKTLDSLNYCLEMHKVRKNKKADFDIHSSSNLHIEDYDIDKFELFTCWKDLSKESQETHINNYIETIIYKYKLEKDYIRDFIKNNINKIKYDKVEQKILEITDMLYIKQDDLYMLKIKQKKNLKKSDSINKLRKSLKSLKK
jgi:hypothetical protein